MTRTPKLDEIFTAAESKFQKHGEAKNTEKDLLHIIACTLDVVRPLVDIIEGVNRGQLTPADVKERAIDALSLLGNAVAHTSQIRRKRILKVCNPDTASLAENKELYLKSPPMLCGEGFEQKMKERAGRGCESSPQKPGHLPTEAAVPVSLERLPLLAPKRRRLWTQVKASGISKEFRPLPTKDLHLPEGQVKERVQSGQQLVNTPGFNVQKKEFFKC